MTPASYDWLPAYERRFNPGQRDCEEVTGPNGEIVAKTTSASENGASSIRVDVVRPDGTLVTIIVENIGTDSSRQPPTDACR